MLEFIYLFIYYSGMYNGYGEMLTWTIELLKVDSD